METQHQEQSNNDKEDKRNEFYALNMRPYLHPREYLETGQYFIHQDHFVQNLINRQLRSHDLNSPNSIKFTNNALSSRNSQNLNLFSQSRSKINTFIERQPLSSIYSINQENSDKIKNIKSHISNKTIKDKSPQLKLHSPPARLSYYQISHNTIKKFNY